MKVSLLATLAVLTGACSPEAATAVDRYLYVVDCEAQVDKLDTVTGMKLGTISLSERSALVPKTPSAQAGLDGCIAEDVMQDQATKQVGVIVPTTTRAGGDGKRDFQWLTFTLPDWKFAGAQPAGIGLEAPPFLSSDAAGALEVKRADERSPATDLDVGGYKNAAGVLGSEVIEASGDIALLRLFTGEKAHFTLGLANQRTRVLTLLDDLPPTTVTNVHLTPGGGHVLVEVTQPASAPVQRTGALRLYDAAGKTVEVVTDEGSRAGSFLALTPNGSAVYRSGHAYHFVALGPKGTRFGNAAVTQSLSETRKPGLVFASQ